MKILTNKAYQILLNDIEHKDKSIVNLKEKLKDAKDLKDILKSLYTTDNNILTGFTSVAYVNVKGGYSLNIPDSVLVYVDDILGGKVIKQEGNKCLVIDKTGNVKTGLTKEKVDKGYDYKLIRE